MVAFALQFALLHAYSFPQPSRPLPLHLLVISLIEMDERGYQGVWVESSADRLNKGRSFTHREPIHPGTHTYPLKHTRPRLTAHSSANTLPLNDFHLSGYIILLMGSLVGVLSIQQVKTEGIFSIRYLFIQKY